MGSWAGWKQCGAHGSGWERVDEPREREGGGIGRCSNCYKIGVWSRLKSGYGYSAFRFNVAVLRPVSDSERCTRIKCERILVTFLCIASKLNNTWFDNVKKKMSIWTVFSLFFFSTRLDYMRAIIFSDNKGLHLISWPDCLPFVR